MDRDTLIKTGIKKYTDDGNNSECIVYMWNNAFIACKPKHDIILGAIKACIYSLNNYNIPDEIEKNCSYDDANKYIYNITGGVIFRKIVNGFIFDPKKSKKNIGLLPPLYFYPSVFWYEKNTVDGFIQSYIPEIPSQNLWLHKETLSIHYNKNSYLTCEQNLQAHI